MKILTFLISFLVLTVFFNFSVFAQEVSSIPEPTSIPNVSSYDLFWPLDAGKVPGDSLYFLKTLKWKIKGFLTFGKLNKASFYSLQSKKSLLESEKLSENQRGEKSKESLDKTLEMMKKAIELVKSARENGSEVGLVNNEIISDMDKEILYFESKGNNEMSEKIKSLRSDFVNN